MFHKFSKPAQRVIFFARQEASRLGGLTLSTEHLLLGLLWENSGLVEPLLASGHTVSGLKQAIESAAGSGEQKLATSVEMHLAETAKMVLAYADEESNRLLSPTIDVPHLLLGLLRARDSKAARILADYGLEVDDLRLKLANGTVSAAKEPFGGVICGFYGIEIRFDPTAEGVPRVMAEYRGRVALIEIETAKVMQSDLPARAESIVLEWVALRKDDIIAAWKAVKAGKSAPPLTPLE